MKKELLAAFSFIFLISLMSINLSAKNYSNNVQAKSRIAIPAKINLLADQRSSTEMPNGYSLSQNYPNPFNPSTRIQFSLKSSEKVSLRIYNSLGQLVNELVNKDLPAGVYNFNWDARNVPSGAYFYSIVTSHFKQTKKMVLAK